MWWSNSSGKIELNITKRQAATCSHPCPCDTDVKVLRQAPALRRQLNKLDPDVVKANLLEYGCWEDDELRDHETNLQRLLWLACCDISEGD